MDNITLLLFVFILIIIAFFIIGREIVCWYWKVNESLAVLKEIRDLLAVQSKSHHRATAPSKQAEKTREHKLSSAEESELERQALAMKNPDLD